MKTLFILNKGARRGNLEELAAWSVEADKVIVF
jgi:sulfur relay (sulfurtransferase) complex TusBCD TusD component (DsrE family)